MPLKIGIFGSAEGDFEKILDLAHQLGEELAKLIFDNSPKSLIDSILEELKSRNELSTKAK